MLSPLIFLLIKGLLVFMKGTKNMSNIIINPIISLIPQEQSKLQKILNKDSAPVRGVFCPAQARCSYLLFEDVHSL